MAQFPRNISFDTPHYCRVCRKETIKAKALPGYEDELDFVCEDCCKRFFDKVSYIENLPPEIRFRPADINENEYRAPGVFSHDIIKDTAVYAAAGAVIYIFAKLTDFIYNDGVPGFYAAPAEAIYAAVTLTGGIASVCVLAGGIFRGMDLKRRLLLPVKALVCFAAAAFMAAEAVSRIQGIL